MTTKTGGGKGTNQYQVKGSSAAQAAKDAAQSSPSLESSGAGEAATDSDPMGAAAAPPMSPARAARKAARGHIRAAVRASSGKAGLDAHGKREQLIAAREATDVARVELTQAADAMDEKGEASGWTVTAAEDLIWANGDDAPPVVDAQSHRKAARMYLRAALRNLEGKPGLTSEQKADAIARARCQLLAATTQFIAAHDAVT